jgi:L-fuconolactonase
MAASPREDIIEPDLPIIDPHHHLWDRRTWLPILPPPTHPFDLIARRWPHYMIDEIAADAASGHNIRATVFIECTAFYRASGPDHLKPIGETEAINGVAAQSAAGLYGVARICEGIVGFANLLLGAAVGEVLDAHLAAAPQRFRGIRHAASWDADPAVLGPLNRRKQFMFADPKFREGFAELGKRNLSFEAWLLEPQLPDLIDLARAFPDQPIVLDHVGTPLGIAGYQRREHFQRWCDNIRTLATLPNVWVKLGGLAMPFCGFPSCLSDPPAPSTQLAEEWKPYIDVCIEHFGPKRAMFESNFPVDQLSCDYPTLWNALKRTVSGASADEKADLFFETANRFYRLGLNR